MAPKDSDDASREESEVEESPPRHRANLKWIAVAVSVGLGAALGGIVVGPRLAAGSVDSASESEAESPPRVRDPEGVVALDNIIVNPAGTNGMRFLMVTVALDVGDKHHAEEARGRSLEIRDVVIGVLEQQTLEMLTSPGARQRVKQHLLSALQSLLGDGTVLEILIPHFVVQ